MTQEDKRKAYEMAAMLFTEAAARIERGYQFLPEECRASSTWFVPYDHAKRGANLIGSMAWDRFRALSKKDGE